MNTKNTFPKEHILKLSINEEKNITLICTDAALTELITGYLYNERLISSKADIASMQLSRDHTAAWVCIPELEKFDGALVRASGLGGMQIQSDCRPPFIPLNGTYSLEYIKSCADSMERSAAMYAETGGMHCSALFDSERMLSCFEDIGRHNTLDKISGDRLLRGIDRTDCLLITSGRISSDMVRKAGNCGASVIASFSTPTQMAFDAAADANMSIIAYLKRDPMICFSAGRIV